jgi:hypothetical protein
VLLDRHGPVGFVDGPAVVGVGSSLTPNAENDATTDPEIIAGWSGSTYWNPRWSPIHARRSSGMIVEALRFLFIAAEIDSQAAMVGASGCGRERPHRAGQPDSPLFPSRRGSALSRDAVERRVGKYADAAADRCPSLRDKVISAHVFRHSTAMSLLQAGVDASVIAIWLGHESVRSTDPYLHADMAIKQRALERTAPGPCRPLPSGCRHG